MGMNTGSEGPNGDINVTPLVDVCLVLLIIFMVAVPRAVPELSVRVPPDAPPPEHNPKPTTKVSLDEHGALELDGESITRAELVAGVRQSLALRDRPVAYADFDDDVEYADAMQVLGLMKEGGAQVLGVVASRKNGIPERLPPAR